VRTHNNIVTEYQYNDFGDRLQETSSDRGITTYEHDNASNIIRLVDARGITVNYTYDALNRVTLAAYPDASENITYRYDNCQNGIGRLCEVTDPSGTTTFAYDVYGNITTQTKVELGDTYVTTYTYDDVDKITSITYPNGIRLNYQRDSLSRITNIQLSHGSLSSPQTIVSNLLYRADGKVLQSTLGNGLIEDRSYDLQGRLTSQQLGTLLSRQYSYDANGNILGIDSNTLDPSYSYDALNRLLSESDTTTTDGGSAGNTGAVYQYDPIGNRLSLTQNSLDTLYDYTPSSSQLVKVGEINLTLDAAGNTLTDGEKRFAYNDRNQLESYSENNVAIATYEYNFANLRTQKTLSGDSHLYRYDRQGRRIQDNKNGAANTSTVWLGWQPVAHIQHAANGDIESITYITADQIGAPRLGTNQTQTVVWNWNADAFGTTAPNTDANNNGQHIVIENRLPGNYYDNESGLNYNWNRYRDAEKGRYISSDPIGLKGGKNTYGYAAASPLTYVDFFGLAYKAPGEFGHGTLTFDEGVNIEGWIVDNPDGSINNGIGNDIPANSDVDFYRINGEWHKIKNGDVHLENSSEGASVAPHPNTLTVTYPIDNPPVFWDWKDDQGDKDSRDVYKDYIRDFGPDIPGDLSDAINNPC